MMKTFVNVSNGITFNIDTITLNAFFIESSVYIEKERESKLRQMHYQKLKLEVKALFDKHFADLADSDDLPSIVYKTTRVGLYLFKNESQCTRNNLMKLLAHIHYTLYIWKGIVEWIGE